MKELTEWSEEVNGHPTDFAIESESGTIAFHYDADGNLVEVYVD
jgi:YD repeat-containing protein